MRSMFLDMLIERLKSEFLGIEAGCLIDLDALISRVVQEHGAELRDRGTLVRSVADFEALLGRMIVDARAKGYMSLHEDTLATARSQCGLVFWCS